MMRLIKHGLMFGNLYVVRAPALVERYNRALDHLIGRRTELPEFHVDISGYSPEIGDEFGDSLYLNPNGCNRQFILLSPQQKTAPLLNAQFSTSRSILRQFIDKNEDQLFALTTRDAVAGELVNSVYSVKTPADLLRIRTIKIEADTTENHVSDGTDLRKKIDRFMHDDGAWWDDVLIADMITLAKKTGDITRYPIALAAKSYVQENFYTEHFGGLYIFRDMDSPVAISVADKTTLETLPVDTFLDLSDRNQIARFLDENALSEPIVTLKNAAPHILQQRLDFMLVDVASAAGDDLSGLDRRSLRAIARRHTNALPDEFHALNDLLRWINDGGAWPRITSEHPAYFYSVRARQHKDRDLVNMLLAQLCPRDIRQLFICHKPAFYRAYHTWNDRKRTYVADFLAREYMMDKAGARHALFGPEPDTAEPLDEFGVLPKSGPWGHVRGAS
ncbi:MAG: DUF6638 family protein [Paracoccaceae bacterium]